MLPAEHLGLFYVLVIDIPTLNVIIFSLNRQPRTHTHTHTCTHTHIHREREREREREKEY